METFNYGGIMRTNLLFILALFVAIFSGCSHNDYLVTEKSSVSLKAFNGATTRVVFDGVKSSWSNGDCLDVVVDGLDDIYTFNYNADSEYDFVCDNLTLPAEQNDVVAFYGTDVEQIDVTDKTASVYLGATLQEQSAELPTAHIAKYDILYGKALDVSRDNIQIAMEHSIAVIKVNIENSLAEAKSIKSVTITVPEDVALAGNHVINTMTSEITLADNAEVCKSVTLSFEDAVTLNEDENTIAWIAAAPFAIEAGDEITIDITISDDEVYRSMKVIPESGVTFNAGSIMSTTIKLGDDAKLIEPDAPAEITIVVDPTVDGVMPSDFPDDTKDNVKEGDFVLSGYTFGFESPVPFYLSGNKRIRFESGITKDNVAMIKLPIIDGYKLTAVELQSLANSTRRYRFAIVRNDKTELKGGEAKNIKDEAYTFNLDSSNDNDEYNICISRSDSKVNKNTIDVVFFSLTYTKIN